MMSPETPGTGVRSLGLNHGPDAQQTSLVCCCVLSIKHSYENSAVCHNKETGLQVCCIHGQVSKAGVHLSDTSEEFTAVGAAHQVNEEIWWRGDDS